MRIVIDIKAIPSSCSVLTLDEYFCHKRIVFVTPTADAAAASCAIALLWTSGKTIKIYGKVINFQEEIFFSNCDAALKLIELLKHFLISS